MLSAYGLFPRRLRYMQTQMCVLCTGYVCMCTSRALFSSAEDLSLRLLSPSLSKFASLSSSSMRLTFSLSSLLELSVVCNWLWSLSTFDLEKEGGRERREGDKEKENKRTKRSAFYMYLYSISKFGISDCFYSLLLGKDKCT